MKLSFEHISAAYRKRQVLRDVSFTAESGAITILLGRNGAGKSTLVRCLTGEKQDYTGRICLDSDDVRIMSNSQRAGRLACLPQVLPRPHVTVKELVAFGRTPYLPLTGTLSPEDLERVEWAISVTGLLPFERAFVDELSGGERKKAFFAMTLAQDTPVVVLDEPTAHLDAVSRFEFLNLLEQLCRETGKTFLAVMHELPEVLRYADHIVVLHDRQVAFSGTAAACLSAGIPESCFQIHVAGSRADGYAVRPL